MKLELDVRTHKNPKTATEYHVVDREPDADNLKLDIILFLPPTRDPKADPPPDEFGLYIWHAPHGDRSVWDHVRPQRFADVIELITGRKVARVVETSGNGHGVLAVTYV